MVVEAEIAKLRKFQEFLRTDDKLVFQDLLNQCKLYAPYASTMVSTIKEVPLFISMLFGQHKKIIELEKKILMLETLATKTETIVSERTVQGPVEKVEANILQILLLGSFLSPMFTQPVGNYYRSEKFLYRSSSNLGLFLKNTIGLRIKHLHELHLIAHFRFHT